MIGNMISAENLIKQADGIRPFTDQFNALGQMVHVMSRKVQARIIVPMCHKLHGAGSGIVTADAVQRIGENPPFEIFRVLSGLQLIKNHTFRSRPEDFSVSASLMQIIRN